MATPRAVGGYIDCELLERAIGANGQARALVSAMAEVVAQDRRLVAPMVRLACVLATQLDALTEMRDLRRRRGK